MSGIQFMNVFGGSQSITSSFTASVSQTSSGGTLSGGRTYATVNIGTASANRYIVVTHAVRSVGTMYATNISVGGSNMNLAVRNISSNTTNTCTSIWISSIPIVAGTTANIVTTLTGTAVNAEGIGVYALYGLTNNTPTATAQDISNSNPILNLNVNSGGTVIAVAYAENQGATIGTWTGVTSDYNTTCTTGGNILGGGSAILVPAASPRLVSLAYSATSLQEASACSASFS